MAATLQLTDGRTRRSELRQHIHERLDLLARDGQWTKLGQLVIDRLHDEVRRTDP